MNYLPSLTKQNSLRLTARYQAVAQELGELGYQANLTWSPAKVTPSQPTFHIFQTLKMSSSFRKSTLMWKCARRPHKLLVGLQLVKYNQAVFEFKPNAALVEPITPFVEFTYKFDRKNPSAQSFSFRRTTMILAAGCMVLLNSTLLQNGLSQPVTCGISTR